MIVPRSVSLSVCIHYLFLGKYMESKTQVTNGMTISLFTQNQWTSVRQNTGKYHQDFPVKLRLDNNYHNKHYTFDLCTGRHQLYKKPNDTPTYINVNSNHPPNIIKALSDIISKRVSNISSDKATLIMPHLPRVDTKKILFIKKISHLQIK